MIYILPFWSYFAISFFCCPPTHLRDMTTIVIQEYIAVMSGKIICYAIYECLKSSISITNLIRFIRASVGDWHSNGDILASLDWRWTRCETRVVEIGIRQSIAKWKKRITRNIAIGLAIADVVIGDRWNLENQVIYTQVHSFRFLLSAKFNKKAIIGG